MPSPQNQFQQQAAEAARRIERARELEQLSLFPGDPSAEDARAGGRGKGKAMSTLRSLMAQRGHRMPEDVLAHIGALDDPEGPEMAALKKAEAVALALYGHAEAPASVRLRLFETFYAATLRALDAMLPYGLAKITPDAAPVQATQVIIYGGPGQSPVQGAAQAIEGRAVAPRLAPPPMPHQIQQKQGLAGSPVHDPDGAIRTDGATHWKGDGK
jgi:hypothetical protein